MAHKISFEELGPFEPLESEGVIVFDGKKLGRLAFSKSFQTVPTSGFRCAIIKSNVARRYALEKYTARIHTVTGEIKLEPVMKERERTSMSLVGVKSHDIDNCVAQIARLEFKVNNDEWIILAMTHSFPENEPPLYKRCKELYPDVYEILSKCVKTVKDEYTGRQVNLNDSLMQSGGSFEGISGAEIEFEEGQRDDEEEGEEPENQTQKFQEVNRKKYEVEDEQENADHRPRNIRKKKKKKKSDKVKREEARKTRLQERKTRADARKRRKEAKKLKKIGKMKKKKNKKGRVQQQEELEQNHKLGSDHDLFKFDDAETNELDSSKESQLWDRLSLFIFLSTIRDIQDKVMEFYQNETVTDLGSIKLAFVQDREKTIQRRGNLRKIMKEDLETDIPFRTGETEFMKKAIGREGSEPVGPGAIDIYLTVDNCELYYFMKKSREDEQEEYNKINRGVEVNAMLSVFRIDHLSWKLDEMYYNLSGQIEMLRDQIKTIRRQMFAMFLLFLGLFAVVFYVLYIMNNMFHQMNDKLDILIASNISQQTNEGDVGDDHGL